MPLLGLIDWIVISIIGLAIGFGLVCYMLINLHDWVSFKPKTYYRNATMFQTADRQWHSIQAPDIYGDHYHERKQNLKWYHRLILGP